MKQRNGPPEAKKKSSDAKPTAAMLVGDKKEREGGGWEGLKYVLKGATKLNKMPSCPQACVKLYYYRFSNKQTVLFTVSE